MLKLNLENIKYKLLSYGIYSNDIKLIYTGSTGISKLYYLNSLITVNYECFKLSEEHIMRLSREIINYEKS